MLAAASTDTSLGGVPQMRAARFPLKRRFAAEEDGSVLVTLAVMIVVLLGFVALTVDIGRSLFLYRELQASCDAAALAGAGVLPTVNAVATATHYSGIAGAVNYHANLPNVQLVSGYPVVKCLTTLTATGMACVSPGGANAVQVQQKVTIPLYFAGLFGHPTMDLFANSVASSKGGSPTPNNIAIIVDTTLSMNEYDADCGATQMSCVLSGIQTLLHNFSPCQRGDVTCTITAGQSADSVERVSLFTFPNLTTSTVSIDSNCTTAVPAPTQQNGYINYPGLGYIVMPPSSAWSGIPTAASYSFPTPLAANYTNGTAYSANPKNQPVQVTYQVTPFLSDYRTADTNTTLNPLSTLVQAAGGTPACGGMQPSNYDGVYGTYYAGALYAAQSALFTQRVIYPDAGNVIIILSDGDATSLQTSGWTGGPYYSMGPPANSSGVYPSYAGECGQAVVAAQSAAAAGTKVYSVAYGSPSTGCASDVGVGTYPNISPCNTMAALASAPQYFYSDYNQSGSGSTCVASQPVTSLSQIFFAIAQDLTTARLIPPNTT
jgi:Flp pilus assembly protein TadG